jgi:ParB/Sulfiredoxin domain
VQRSACLRGMHEEVVRRILEDYEMTFHIMPMSEILTLESGDYGMPMHEALARIPLYTDLMDSIKENGQTHPVLIDEEECWIFDKKEVVRIVANGHHRIKVLYELGINKVLWTSDGWNDSTDHSRIYGTLERRISG